MDVFALFEGVLVAALEEFGFDQLVALVEGDFFRRKSGKSRLGVGSSGRSVARFSPGASTASEPAFVWLAVRQVRCSNHHRGSQRKQDHSKKHHLFVVLEFFYVLGRGVKV